MIHNQRLIQKSWFRGIEIIFFFVSVVCSIGLFDDYSQNKILNTNNVKILGDLYPYAAQAKPNQYNITLSFLNLDGDTGCIDHDTGLIRELNSFDTIQILKNIRCGADITENDKENIFSGMPLKLRTGLVCFTNEEYKGNCRSDRIIKFKRKLNFFLEPLLLSLVPIVIFLILDFIIRIILINISSENLISFALRIFIICLLIWAQAPHSSDFYSFLRFSVFGVSSYCGSLAYEMKKISWIWIFGSIALLFNPLLPIYFKKENWFFIDIIVVIFFIVSLFIIKKNKEIKTDS